MTTQPPYARVYFSIVDDTRFEHVYDDDAALATWLRLLIVAEGTWPASPPVPRWVKPRTLQLLLEAGILEKVTGDRYRIHGLDAERERRKSQAQRAARTRWDAQPNAPAMRQQSTSNAPASGPAYQANMPTETRRDETRRDEPRRARANGEEAGQSFLDLTLVVEEVTNRPWTYGQGSKVFETLRDDVKALGRERVEAEYRAVVKESSDPLDAAGVVFGAHKRLYRIPDGPSGNKSGKGKSLPPDMEEVKRAFNQD